MDLLTALGQHFSQASLSGGVVEVPFGAGEHLEDTENGSFVALYTRGLMPYARYREVGEEVRERKFSAVLMCLRWDHMLGFPGGSVDRGESLLEAAIRELKEEVHLKADGNKFERVCSHAFRRSSGRFFVSNLYAMEVGPEALINTLANSYKARDYHPESMGAVILRFETPAQGKGIEITLNGAMPPSVREEIDVLMERMTLVEPEHLSHLRRVTGYLEPKKIGFGVEPV